MPKSICRNEKKEKIFNINKSLKKYNTNKDIKKFLTKNNSKNVSHNNNRTNLIKNEIKKINNYIKENKGINEESKKNYKLNNESKGKNMTELNSNTKYNFHLKNKKLIDGGELYWNIKNDYSKDIDISLISISNKKNSLKNNKLYPTIFNRKFNYHENNNDNNNNFNNDNNNKNINNSIINIKNNQDDLTSNNKSNKKEYASKLEILETENIILKNEIRESKCLISLLENRIEELLDDKNSKEDKECPQPTPYVIKYTKDIIAVKKSSNEPKIKENTYEKFYNIRNKKIKEYSKVETKETEISNKLIKNEE